MCTVTHTETCQDDSQSKIIKETQNWFESNCLERNYFSAKNIDLIASKNFMIVRDHKEKYYICI